VKTHPDHRFLNNQGGSGVHVLMKSLAGIGLLFALLVSFVGYADARAVGGSRLSAASRLSDTEAQQYLRSIRTLGYEGQYVFRFRIRHYPPKGRTITYHGTLYGDSNPLTGLQFQRLRIQDPAAGHRLDALPLVDLLLERGFRSQAWTVDSDTKSALVNWNGDALHHPILKDLNLTYFDLLAPWVMWSDFDYLGPGQVKARPSQEFRLRSEESSGANHSVVINLDAEFRAILTSQVLDEKGEAIKSMELIAFKKVGDDYVPRMLDYRDQIQKGNRTRIEILAAAMNVEIPLLVFDPANLLEAFPEFPIPPMEQF
jgi:hypothetical protein